MTATEALIRAQEKGDLLSPVGLKIQAALADLIDIEFDIYEGKGSNPFTVWGTPHNRNIHSGGTINSSTSLTDNYHTYAINWSQDRIQWYFNGQLFHEFKATDPGAQPYPFNLEFYLILNLAIGGGFGGPVDQSLTTGTMSIDYIRFYSNDGVGQVFVR
jgi:beta-glucanase (GH16 family)